MKPDEQFLKDRLAMFETEGWKDLMADMKITEENVVDIRTLESEKDLQPDGPHEQLKLEIDMSRENRKDKLL